MKRTLKAVEYYLDIYRNSLERVLEMCGKSPDEITIVDYGGGHGLLGILAKKLDFRNVIYVDYSADALNAVRQMGETLGVKPNVMLQGDAATLKEWCRENDIVPDALLAMDVIEHIYVLDDFFACIYDISPRMKMVFTTASTPFNARVVRRLHKAMQADELGTTTHKGFWQMRRDYIQKLQPEMSDRELDYWADNTRGLIYNDVARAVEAQSPNLLLDPYNTCNPVTGSWTERILPIDDYRQLMQPYGFNLTVLPGRYNEYRRGPKLWMSRHYNKTIDKAPAGEPHNMRERRRYKKALKVAPFIYLIVG
ncbi:MAG: SAM-dependent methyltransferase [Bacteroidales bacterium]|nr:SAM-dependent methyltransferase [Bacteroidales bacterium]